MMNHKIISLKDSRFIDKKIKRFLSLYDVYYVCQTNLDKGRSMRDKEVRYYFCRKNTKRIVSYELLFRINGIDENGNIRRTMQKKGANIITTRYFFPNIINDERLKGKTQGLSAAAFYLLTAHMATLRCAPKTAQKGDMWVNVGEATPEVFKNFYAKLPDFNLSVEQIKNNGCFVLRGKCPERVIPGKYLSRIKPLPKSMKIP